MRTAALVVVPALVGAALASAGCGGGGSGSSAEDSKVATTPAASDQAVVSSQDCTTLQNVIADIAVGAHADDVVPIALDITPRDYVSDGDFLSDYLSRAPEAIRADVELLGRWIGRYASAAQSVGVASGDVPTLDQLFEINTASHLDSREQDLLPLAIEALRTWAGGGCSGERPVIPPRAPPVASGAETETETVAEPTNPLAKAADEAELGESVDAVTEAVNEVVQARTEDEFATASSDSEIRNCRKVRTLSEGALIAPGGTGFVCEVWRDGTFRWEAPAIIDVDGNVATAP